MEVSRVGNEIIEEPQQVEVATVGIEVGEEEPLNLTDVVEVGNEVKPNPVWQQGEAPSKLSQLTDTLFMNSNKKWSAKASNSLVYSDLLRITPSEAWDMSDELDKQFGGHQLPTTMEVIELGFKTAIAGGFIMNPLMTTIGLAGFETLGEIENKLISVFQDEEYKFRAGKGFKDLLPEDVNEVTQNAVEALDFAWKGGILGKGMQHPKFRRGLAKAILKNKPLKKLFIEKKVLKKALKNPIKGEDFGLLKSLMDKTKGEVIEFNPTKTWVPDSVKGDLQLTFEAVQARIKERLGDERGAVGKDINKGKDKMSELKTIMDSIKDPKTPAKDLKIALDKIRKLQKTGTKDAKKIDTDTPLDKTLPKAESRDLKTVGAELGRKRAETSKLKAGEGLGKARAEERKLAKEYGVLKEERKQNIRKGKKVPSLTETDEPQIKVGEFDKFLPDSHLAEQNPLYKNTVKGYHKLSLEGGARIVDKLHDINKLTNAARKSRKRSLTEKLIPMDKKVFEYLSNENKTELAKSMTKEELALAKYIEKDMKDILAQLIEKGVLKEGLDNYITNIRRDFLEAMSEGGFKKAFKEFQDEFKLDEQKFDAFTKDGKPLPFEQFFKYSLERTGNINPTQNVAKAYMKYIEAFEKKNILDVIIPAVTKTVKMMKPKEGSSPLAFETHKKLGEFMQTWMKNKKGMPDKLLLEPGGRWDRRVSMAKAWIAARDLGLNLTVGPASNVGEFGMNYIMLGKAKIMSGMMRKQTAQGKTFLKQYENFTGRTFWSEIQDANKGAIEHGSDILFSFFHNATVRANKTFLLSSITEAEFKSGTISSSRLADIKIEMGRYRSVKGMKSIIGSTTEGGVFMQYKGWAAAPLLSMSKNLKSLGVAVAKGDTITKQQKMEIIQAVELTTSILIAKWAVDGYDNKLIGKLTREGLSLVGAMNPKFWAANPILSQNLVRLANISENAAKAKEYKRGDKEGEFKADDELLNFVTPVALKQVKEMIK